MKRWYNIAGENGSMRKNVEKIYNIKKYVETSRNVEIAMRRGSYDLQKNVSQYQWSGAYNRV